MKKLIIIEGIDNSGKSTIAKEMANRFNFRFDHEPTFSSTFADQINFENMNSYQREFYFLIDRYKHQEVLKEYDTIMDRYILSGLAYASAFGKDIFGKDALVMARFIYQLQEFKKPNLTIFVDMHPENAMKLNDLRRGTETFNPKLTIEKLNDIRRSYYNEIAYIQTNWNEDIIIYEPIFGDIQTTFDQVYDLIQRELNL